MGGPPRTKQQPSTRRSLYEPIPIIIKSSITTIKCAAQFVNLPTELSSDGLTADSMYVRLITE